MSELYIGLMSGTSMDGIDAVLVNFTDTKLTLISQHHHPLPSALRQEILALCSPGDNEINRMGQLDVQLGLLFAETANTLISKSSVDKTTIKAIGSHGQTIRHHPKGYPPLESQQNALFPFTLQIADPNIIAAETGITTVADFRRRDIAHGGQGAPLVPAFHAWLFHNANEDRAVINLGGIANVTLLNKDKKEILGFDIGPANTLLDAWIHHTHGLAFDENGQWAATGQVHFQLLQDLLADTYFQAPPPKSTGREYFNLPWLQQALQKHTKIKSEDVQATLVALTAQSIGATLQSYLPPQSKVLLCGGGTYNGYLREQLAKTANHYEFHSSEKFGIAPQWVEATAFAWLARQTLQGLPGNIPSVTGANKNCVLGGVYYSLSDIL